MSRSSCSPSSPRLSPHASPLGPWAAPFGDEARARCFVSCVERVLLERYGSDAMVDPVGGLAVFSDGRVLRFDNLARIAARAGTDAWPQLVDDDLELLDGAVGEAVVTLLADPDRALAAVRRRLVDPAALAVFDHDGPVGHPVSPGCVAVPVLELGSAVAIVDPRTIRSWGLALDEVWERAAANDRAAPTPQRLPCDPGFGRVISFEGDLCTTGAALRLDELVELGPMGALVTAPVAHRLNVVTLGEHDAPGFARHAASELLAVSSDDFLTAPNPVSAEVLWFRPGVGLEAALIAGRGAIEVVASDPLRTLLLG